MIYSVEFQIRENKKNVLKIVEPDLKNLCTMKEVWAFLDQEYGQIMEMNSDIVNSLISFTFSADKSFRNVIVLLSVILLVWEVYFCLSVSQDGLVFC